MHIISAEVSLIIHQLLITKNEAGVTDFPLTAKLSDNAIDLVADKIAKKVNIKSNRCSC